MLTESPISLARTPPLTLGRLAITPATREVRHADGAMQLLEPRVMLVLAALAETPGAIVGRDELAARCWGRAAVSEDAINRVISRLRKVADGIGKGSFRVETVARVGYRLVELSDAPAAAARPDPPNQPAAEPVLSMQGDGPLRRGRARLMLAALAAVLIATAAIFWLRSTRVAGAAPVLVEPLRTPAADREAQALSEGLSTTLARTIVGSDPSITIVDPGDDPPRRTAPGYVIAGRASSRDGMLDVSVRLDDAGGGGILWSRDFSRPAAERDALRQQVAAGIADVLVCALGPQRRAERPLDADTLRLLLAACEQRHVAFAASAPLFRQVVERRPDFAPAWARLAATTALAADFGPEDQRAALMADAVASAHRALALQPDEGAAYLALAIAASGPDRWTREAALLDKGLAAAPDNPQLTLTKANALAEIGREADARRLFARAYSLDPFAPIFAGNLAYALAFGGSPREAAAVLDEADRLWPGEFYTRFARFTIAARIGRPDDARRLLVGLEQTRALRANDVAIWRRLLALRDAPSRGLAAPALAAVVRPRADATPAELMFDLETLVQLGRVDDAYRLAARIGDLNRIDRDHLFRGYMAPFRRDPRFMPLVARTGFTAIWEQTGLWPDFCRIEHLPDDCRAAATASSQAQHPAHR